MRRGQSGIHALIGVDKPVALSSHDVIAHVRRATGEGRVGHAGTLDPAASGVLVVGIGQAARLLGQLTLDVKSYVARIAFGCQTATDDAEGEIIRELPVPDDVYSEDFAVKYLASCKGSIKQLPPAYSAISQGGRRAYQAARAGEPLDLSPREVSLLDIQLLEINQECASWICAMTVSKGFYVRSFARDLGCDLHTAAHLESLRRTASGSISLSECFELDYIDTHDASDIVAHTLDPVKALGLPACHLSVAEAQDARFGRPLALDVLDAARNTEQGQCVSQGKRLADGQRCALVLGTKLVGIWQRTNNALTCCMNFPEGIVGVRTTL